MANSIALDLLKHVPAFGELSDDELKPIADVAVVRRFKSGTRVVTQGDEGDTCYVIKSGAARVIREHSDGRVITLAALGPEDIFGELAMFDGEVRSATVDIDEDAELLAITGKDVRLFLAKHPRVTVKLLTGLARRLRIANERISRQSFQGVAGRVSRSLLDLVEGGPAGQAITIHASQTDLAQLASTSRESVSRFLSTLEKAKVVQRGRGKVTVLDREALERYVY